MRTSAPIALFALSVIASCVLRPPSLTTGLRPPTPSLPSGPAAAPVEAAESGHRLIEAGCSFSGSDIKGEPGSLHQVACPAGCEKATNVIGTEVYASDSPVCAAAVHAGAISDHGGEATVVVEAGRPAYRGSKRNGISSRDWGAYRGSFRFYGVKAAPPPEPEVAAGPVFLDAGCSFNPNELQAEAGTVYRVSCPGGCNSESQPVRGTDTYSGDSSICLAAVHAGLASLDRGGEFLMVLGEGKPAFRGSKRNGIQSTDWGASRSSCRFKR